jgi:hypothetical protein
MIQETPSRGETPLARPLDDDLSSKKLTSIMGSPLVEPRLLHFWLSLADKLLRLINFQQERVQQAEQPVHGSFELSWTLARGGRPRAGEMRGGLLTMF